MIRRQHTAVITHRNKLKAAASWPALLSAHPAAREQNMQHATAAASTSSSRRHAQERKARALDLVQIVLDNLKTKAECTKNRVGSSCTCVIDDISRLMQQQVRLGCMR